MAQGSEAIGTGNALGVLGIDEREESIYRWLLPHPGTTAHELCRHLPFSLAEGRRLLDRLESKGLATHSPERPRRYFPAPPDIAIDALAQHRESEIRRARAVAADLRKEMTHTAAHPEQIIEMVTNRNAERQIFEQLQRAAQKEIVSLVRPPILISRLDVPYEEDQLTQRQAQRRGVRYRGIVDAEFLAVPGAVARVLGDIESGEEIRVFPRLPFKLGMADHKIALIPLSLEQPHAPSLVVRSSALLDALYALFEILWERAVPLSTVDSDSLPESLEFRRPLPREAAELISLMAAGLQDKAMAYELRISSSTLTRRINELMRALGVRTRFQLGWVAARLPPEQER